MTIVPTIALIVSLGALVTAVVRAREPNTFPLVTLMKEWFPRLPALDHWWIGVGAGVSSVVVVPVISWLGGWGQIALAEPVTGRWLGLAVAGVVVKTAFVVFEEFIFRGALVSQIRRRTHPAVAVGVSALVFAAAHSGRSWLDAAILFADGIGFALAFVATGSLWIPAIWHVSKNVSVWLFLGSGTIDLTPGPFAFQQFGAGPVLGSSDSAGLLDLGITIVIVGLVTWSQRRSRSRGAHAVRTRVP